MLHPRLSIALPSAAMLVGIAYAVGGHPSALLWGLGVAVLLALPDLTHRFVRPFRSLESMHLWMHIAFGLLGLSLAASFPIAWWVNVPVGRSATVPFRHDGFAQGVVGLFAITGLVATAWTLADWWRHRDDYASRLT